MGGPYAREKPDLYLTAYTEIISAWIVDLSIKPLQLLEENIKQQIVFYQNFCSLKDNRKMKSYNTRGKHLSVLSGKGLVSRLYKELSKQNNKTPFKLAITN